MKMMRTTLAIQHKLSRDGSKTYDCIIVNLKAKFFTSEAYQQPFSRSLLGFLSKVYNKADRVADDRKLMDCLIIATKYNAIIIVEQLPPIVITSSESVILRDEVNKVGADI